VIPLRSIQIHSRIEALRKQAAAIPEKAKDRGDRLMEIQGRITELHTSLGEAIAAEDGARMTATGRIVGGSSGFPSTASQVLGARTDFAGIQPGFRASVTVPAGPAFADPTIPGFGEQPHGFAETLQQATTEGAISYLRRVSSTNAAAQWKDADGDKPESAYAWEEISAPLTWIAHHTPISKTQASDYGSLQSTIDNEMMAGLRQVRDREALVGDNANGIIGILNTVGIQTHTVASGDNAYDAIRRMVTKVRVTSGFAPTHVALSPLVAETLDLLKDDNKQYLQVKDDNKVWNLEVIEDTNLAVTDEADVEHNGVLVYSAIGGTIYTKEVDNVQVGLVDDQFTKNAYTLLAEGRNAVGFRFPDAFCYCADAIPAAEPDPS